ncbi:hypothetical protein ALC53_07737 [Atta colombica]|uniref:Uncharacterized protein n=1 Tax=Atta colombica TaxID=520822 RepID=A0A195BC20_9HYME|nr:hypothetical protein ALC53_07737 [Atta colombica]
MMLRYDSRMLICIVRSSIVQPRMRSIDLLVSSNLGLLRTILFIDKNLDFVPADYVATVRRGLAIDANECTNRALNQLILKQSLYEYNDINYSEADLGYVPKTCSQIKDIEET